MQNVICPRCRSRVQVPSGQKPSCRNCGYGSGTRTAQVRPLQAAQAQRAPAASAQAYRAPPPQYYGQGAPHYGHAIQAPVTQGVAIAALVINILLIPGVGTLMGRRVGSGIAQLLLFILGIPLTLLLIGIPMMLGS